MTAVDRKVFMIVSIVPRYKAEGRRTMLGCSSAPGTMRDEALSIGTKGIQNTTEI